MLFSVQYSSAKCWIRCGLQPDVLVGHSFGHLTALCIAGCLTLEEGIRLVSGRARLLQDCWTEGSGCMMAMEAEKLAIQEIISAVNAQPRLSVDLACDNGANTFVLAGDQASINKVEELCSHIEPPLKTTRLANTHAYHSRIMDNILPQLKDLVSTIDFKSPCIPIETCTRQAITSSFDAEHIARHTRDTVYFGDAVKRIAQRVGGAIWLEIGTATPITNMARRILNMKSHSEMGSHAFIPVDLREVRAFKSLASATTRIWNAGLPAFNWTFASEADRAMILPPYEFEKKRHWMNLKFSPRQEDRPVTERDQQHQLIKLVQHDLPSGKMLFSVDVAHALYNYGVEGHAVGGQGLCPASMYVELAVQCALVARLENNKARDLPHVTDMQMVSPLGLGVPKVEITLSKSTSTSNLLEWDFVISSQSNEGDHRQKQHATGRITLRGATDTASEAQLNLLRKVVRSSRFTQIVSSSSALGITGPMVYRAFSEVVQYAKYYQNVASIFGCENEAAGIVKHNVSAGHSSHPSLPAGVSAPILMDNFLQVLGIHANCLTERNSGEVSMCIGIDEIIFSTEFSQRSDKSQEWKVYTRSTPDGPQVAIGDIFVFQAETDLLVLALVGVRFRSVQFKSVLRALNKSTKEVAASNVPNYDADSGYQSSASTTLTDTSPSPKSLPEESVLSSHTRYDVSKDHVESKIVNDKTSEVQKMLMEILELETDEVSSGLKLEALGIDSLMVTEVITEIRKRFDIPISAEKFQDLDDVASLCNFVNKKVKGTSTLDTRDAVPQQLTTIGGNAHESPVEDFKSIRATDPLETIPEQNYDFAAIIRNSFQEASGSFDDYAKDTRITNFYKKVYPDQSKLVATYVIEAFFELGCDLAQLIPGEMVPPVSYIPRHLKVMKQLFGILEDAGLITLDEREGSKNRWLRTTTPTPSTPAASLHQEVLGKYPQHSSETQLLRSTASQLAGCLSGTADPLALLFGDAKARSLMQDVYTNAPMFKTGTLMLSRYLSSILQQLVAEGAKTNIKVLELGGGTGGTTYHLLQTISSILGADSPVKVTYVFTDISSSLVTAAKRRFAAYPFVQYAVLNIEEEPSPHLVGGFDIILSTNCIHATRNLVTSTSHIHKMLRPEGVLCLVELTRNVFWFDLVFGLLEGWWLFDDGRSHALADETRWAVSLRQAGFAWVDWSKGKSQESELLRLIVASPATQPSLGISTSAQVESLGYDKETLVFKEVDGLQLKADVYYPPTGSTSNDRQHPIGM